MAKTLKDLFMELKCRVMERRRRMRKRDEKKKEKKKKKERERDASSLLFLPKWLREPALYQAEAKRQELLPGAQHEC